MHARYAALGVTGCATAADAVAGATLVFCTVTADQAVAAARSAAPHLEAGAYWLDLNSCAPGSKRAAAAAVEAAGGRYVDVAVVSPIYPKRNLSPLLISGPHAETVAPILRDLPMDLRVVPGEVGRASAIKMVRSVMIKGIEAVSAECALAAAAAGVMDEVIPSLALNYPGVEWDGQIGYNLERALVHGTRRAAEMEEVVKTLQELGLPAGMSGASVAWQRLLAGAEVIPPAAPRDVGATGLAPEILPHVRKGQDTVRAPKRR